MHIRNTKVFDIQTFTFFASLKGLFIFGRNILSSMCVVKHKHTRVSSHVLWSNPAYKDIVVFMLEDAEAVLVLLLPNLIKVHFMNMYLVT